MKNRKTKHLLSAAALFAMVLIAFGAAEQTAAQIQSDKEIRLPELIAHRGASWLAPENTLASVVLAWEMDADAVEIDIYLTSDNQIVLFHDATTKRTAGRDGLVEEQTLEQLRELDVGSWKGPQWEGEKIATLDQALATVPE